MPKEKSFLYSLIDLSIDRVRKTDRRVAEVSPQTASPALLVQRQLSDALYSKIPDPQKVGNRFSGKKLRKFLKGVHAMEELTADLNQAELLEEDPDAIIARTRKTVRSRSVRK